MNNLSKSDVLQIFNSIKEVIGKNSSLLVELDSAMGDGDLGLYMDEGFTKICNNLPIIENENSIGTIIMKSGFIMANSAPSTLGTLIATAMIKAGDVVKGKNSIDLADSCAMLKAAINGIEKRGKAQRGEKTVLDSLYPALEELERAVDENKTLPDAIESAYSGAKRGVEESRNMKSVHGRAAYYGDKSIGRQDGGATVGMFIFEGIFKYLNNNK